MIAYDTETTGTDHYHGARAFLVTTYNEDGNTFWEWPVDPLTRRVDPPKADLEAIRKLILDGNEELVLHNARFDVATTNMHIPLPQEMCWWPWERTHDTLVAAHVLGSALPHGLDDCAIQYLGYHKMEMYETRVEKAAKEARAFCQRYLKHWSLTKHGHPMMPSVKKSGGGKDKNGQAKDKNWKSDMWLLKALLAWGEENHGTEDKEHYAKIRQFRKAWTGEHGEGLCADYANLDTEVTYLLWPVLKAELHRRGLWEIYKERMRLLPISYRMERNGLTLSETRLTELVNRFDKKIEDNHEICMRIARELNYPLEMPKGASNNDSLKTFCFGEATVSCSVCKKRVTNDKGKVITDRVFANSMRGKKGTCRFCKKSSEAVVREWPWLDFPVLKETDSGQPSLDNDVIDMYLKGEELSEHQRTFLEGLTDYRDAGKAVQALVGYRSFWLPLPGKRRLNPLTGEIELPWRLIHPGLNPTGTDTLRWSSKNPNLQNISKDKEYNARYVFGPAPGREHWSFDFKNIELRIPAWESGQQELIDLFLKMDEPPFYGSEHLLNFSVIYPEIWEKELAEQIKNPNHIKELYKDEEYQWIKNTDFGLQYDCGDAKADKTSHRVGTKKKLQQRFAKKTALANYWKTYANRHGFVETMPRKSVNPNKGYPLMLIRTERGSVMPTKVMAYRVSGTAMDLTGAAMIACQEQLDVWNRECGIPDHYRMPLQVHDELFFDWPAAEHPKKNPRRSNLGRARIIQRLMEACGEDIICKRLDGTIVSIPTPVSVEYHPETWASGIAF